MKTAPATGRNVGDAEQARQWAARYTVISELNEHGGYTVMVRAVPSIVTEGDSIHDALANACEAIEMTVAGSPNLGVKTQLLH